MSKCRLGVVGESTAERMASCEYAKGKDQFCCWVCEHLDIPELPLSGETAKLSTGYLACVDKKCAYLRESARAWNAQRGFPEDGLVNRPQPSNTCSVQWTDASDKGRGGGGMASLDPEFDIDKLRKTDPERAKLYEEMVRDAVDMAYFYDTTNLEQYCGRDNSWRMEFDAWKASGRPPMDQWTKRRKHETEMAIPARGHKARVRTMVR